MYSLKLKDKWFDVPEDEINYDPLNTFIVLISNDTTIYDVEELLSPFPSSLDIYTHDHSEVVASIKDCDKVTSLQKEYQVHVNELDENVDIIRLIVNKTSLEERLSRNELAVESNTSNIALNTHDIEENTQNIATSMDSIEKNEAQTFYTAMMTDTLLEEE